MDPNDKSGDVYSSDAPDGPYDHGHVDLDTGHQTAYRDGSHVSRDRDTGWHSTDHSKDKGDSDRHRDYD